MRARSRMVDVVTSPGGIRAWHVPTETPSLSLRFVFDGAGTMQSPPEQPSLVWLDTLMFADDGAGPYSGQEMRRRIEESQIGLGMGADGLSTTVSLQTIAPFRDEAFELLSHALLRSHYESDALERIRSQAVNALEWDARQPDVAGSLALSRLLFGSHPFTRPGSGTIASVKSLTAAELGGWRCRALARANMQVTAVGSLPAGELGLALDRALGELPATAVFTPEPAVERRPPGIEHVERDLEQSLVLLARQTDGLTRRESIAWIVLSRILNDTNTGRLYRELREERGLVYWSSVFIAEDRLATTCRASLGTSPDTVAEAIATVRSVLARMGDEGPSQDEMATIHEAAEGTHLHGIDTTDQLADYLAGLQYFGWPPDAIDTRVADIRSVTADEVRALAAKLSGDGEFSIVTVGRRA